jgi:hypothetical protein
MKPSILIFFILAVFLLTACGTVPAAPTETTAPAEIFEPVTVQGTYELYSDIKGGEAFTFVADMVNLKVTFTATSQADNTMKGSAQASYVAAHEFRYEEEGYEACHQRWMLEPITWTAELTGTIQHNPDGSLTVALIANPKDGPSFTQNFNCEGEESTTPQFPYIVGLLVDGRYVHDPIYRLHPMQTGSKAEMIKMEVVE